MTGHRRLSGAAATGRAGAGSGSTTRSSSPASARNLRVWDIRNADGLLDRRDRARTTSTSPANTQPLKVDARLDRAAGAAEHAPPRSSTTSTSRSVSPDGTQTFLGNDFAAGVSTTGGAADTLNNVEMVLVNTPAPGDWTIRVTATAVNVGNPGQGYAVVASGDLAEPPVSTGVQDTLVVRVTFADVAFEPSLPNLQNTMAEVGGLHRRGQLRPGHAASRRSAARSPSTTPKDYYYHPDRNLLIELTEEVVAKLVAAEPNVFDTDRAARSSSPTTSTSPATGRRPDRGRTRCPRGFTRPISVSVQSYANPARPLHPRPAAPVRARRPLRPRGRRRSRGRTSTSGTTWAALFNNVHPLVWSKERAGWLTAHGDTIDVHPAPGRRRRATPARTRSRCSATPSTAANRKAIAHRADRGRGDARRRERLLLRRGAPQHARPTSTAACRAAACSSTT